MRADAFWDFECGCCGFIVCGRLFESNARQSGSYQPAGRSDDKDFIAVVDFVCQKAYVGNTAFGVVVDNFADQ